MDSVSWFLAGAFSGLLVGLGAVGLLLAVFARTAKDWLTGR